MCYVGSAVKHAGRQLSLPEHTVFFFFSSSSSSALGVGRLSEFGPWKLIYEVEERWRTVSAPVTVLCNHRESVTPATRSPEAPKLIILWLQPVSVFLQSEWAISRELLVRLSRHSFPLGVFLDKLVAEVKVKEGRTAAIQAWKDWFSVSDVVIQVLFGRIWHVPLVESWVVKKHGQTVQKPIPNIDPH